MLHLLPQWRQCHILFGFNGITCIHFWWGEECRILSCATKQSLSYGIIILQHSSLAGSEGTISTYSYPVVDGDKTKSSNPDIGSKIIITEWNEAYGSRTTLYEEIIHRLSLIMRLVKDCRGRIIVCRLSQWMINGNGAMTVWNITKLMMSSPHKTICTNHLI